MASMTATSLRTESEANSIELTATVPCETAINDIGSADQISHPEAQSAEDESQYPTGAKFYLIFLSACMVLVISEMDSSIVGVAVPVLTHQWHTVQDIGWYAGAYKLTMCSTQFLFGKLYKLFSFKRIFLTSVAIFFFGSVICSTAPSSLVFIIGRAVSGLSCAGITAGTFALLVKTLPLRKRPLYAGIAAAVEGISVIIAPVLGGILVEINWRWCFYINLPLAAAAFIFLSFFMEDWRPAEAMSWKRVLKEIDLVGNLVFIPALTCLFMALSWAGTKYSWSSPTIIALLCIFVVLLAVFVVDQWVKQESATLPPRILKNRSVIAGFVFSMCCNGCQNVILFYMPTHADIKEWFQAVKEFSPQKSGYLMLPNVIGFLVSCLLQGAGVSALGHYVPFMLCGSILMPIFAGLLTTLSLESSITTVAVYLTCWGLAGGIGFQSPQTAVQNSLPAADANIGLAIIIFAQGFGPAIFVVAAQSIFTNRLTANLHQLSPELSATSLESMGLSDLKAHLGPAKLHNVLMGLDQSLGQTWFLAVALACATMLGSASMEWRSVKKKRS